ncbi:phytanoyl-CoA dioxygenase family protein [Actinokineospora enzanensis]|uniref:phytanoyl-CoA dioxygenase family protein n=1 Tax=Actinokineospora enzanensis TaxID=155975 RepID=UPI0003604DB8|nr:phytanoyl-CoA dioxygenase family protein [Actinokineospora enzanensis]
MSDPIRPQTIDVTRYERAGFFRAPDLLDPETLALLTARVEALGARPGPEVVHEKGTSAVRGIHGCHLYDDVCRRLVRLPALLGLAERLVGEPVYVYQFKVNMKQPGAGAAWPWHQDFAFWHREDGMPADRAVNIAVLLDPVHADNGPLRVIPGTHRLGLIDPAPAAAVADGEHDWRRHVSADLAHTVPDGVAESLARSHGTELVIGPAGTVYAFHPSVVHSSSDNRSADRRAMLLVTYNAVANAPRALSRPEFLVSRDTAALTPLAANTL